MYVCVYALSLLATIFISLNLNLDIDSFDCQILLELNNKYFIKSYTRSINTHLRLILWLLWPFLELIFFLRSSPLQLCDHLPRRTTGSYYIFFQQTAIYHSNQTAWNFNKALNRKCPRPKMRAKLTKIVWLSWDL